MGESNDVVAHEHFNLILYDDSNIIEPTFIQLFNKQLQIYGFISLPFASKNRNNLINSENLLRFHIEHEINKESITFELAHSENSGSVSTTDSKVHHISILINKEPKKTMIEGEVTIEGYQNFNNYQKLNPIDIEITDNDVLRKLTKIHV